MIYMIHKVKIDMDKLNEKKKRKRVRAREKEREKLKRYDKPNSLKGHFLSIFNFLAPPVSLSPIGEVDTPESSRSVR